MSEHIGLIYKTCRINKVHKNINKLSQIRRLPKDSQKDRFVDQCSIFHHQDLPTNWVLSKTTSSLGQPLEVTCDLGQ